MGNFDLEVKKPYLCRCASRCSVSNSPRCFLSGTELSLLKDLNEYREDVGINHILTGEKKMQVMDTGCDSRKLKVK